jgi:hypothetical protein
MDNLTIKISSADVSMLRRIAKSENRRFDDFLQLVFADGLNYMFCDESVYVNKEPEEYTEDEQKQLELNNKLDNEGFDNYQEKEAAGYKHVRRVFTNHAYDSETKTTTDELIEPLVTRIRNIALS